MQWGPPWEQSDASQADALDRDLRSQKWERCLAKSQPWQPDRCSLMQPSLSLWPSISNLLKPRLLFITPPLTVWSWYHWYYHHFGLITPSWFVGFNCKTERHEISVCTFVLVMSRNSNVIWTNSFDSKYLVLLILAKNWVENAKSPSMQCFLPFYQEELKSWLNKF